MGSGSNPAALAIVIALAVSGSARAECPGDPADCPQGSDPTWLAIGLGSVAVGYSLAMWGSRSNVRKTDAAIHVAAAVAGAILLAAGTHVWANPAVQNQQGLGPEAGAWLAGTGGLAVITGVYSAGVRVRF